VPLEDINDYAAATRQLVNCLLLIHVNILIKSMGVEVLIIFIHCFMTL